MWFKFGINMTKRDLIFRSLLHILGGAFYVLLVAFMMMSGEKFFGLLPGVVGPFVFFFLFVLSAAVVGSLIFGKPTLLYLEGHKKEAVIMFALSLLWLFILIFFTLVVLVVVNR